MVITSKLQSHLMIIMLVKQTPNLKPNIYFRLDLRSDRVTPVEQWMSWTYKRMCVHACPFFKRKSL